MCFTCALLHAGDSPCEDLPWGGRLFFTQNHDEINGIAAADAACTAESPDGVPAKAILVDEHGCNGQPCRRASLTSQSINGTLVGNGDGQIDWRACTTHSNPSESASYY